MKQKDITVILMTAVISGVFSFILSNALFASPKNRQEKVEVVQAIEPNFPQPDKKYFNENSFDPTQLITIGDNNNNAPFKAN